MTGWIASAWRLARGGQDAPGAAESSPRRSAAETAATCASGQSRLGAKTSYDARRDAIEAEAQRLVATYADTILRVSYTYLHSTQDAEDICQDVLLKTLRQADGFDSAEHERAWVVRTAINAAKDLLRRQEVRSTIALDDIPEPTAPHHASEHAIEARDARVLQSVMALPLEYREAIYLHYYEGYSIKQIAEMVHASESAVATRLSRGRSKLRPILEGVHHELDV